MNKIIYTEDQVQTIRGLLNAVSFTGIQNAKQIAMIAQVLEAGVPAEVNEEKTEKGEG